MAMAVQSGSTDPGLTSSEILIGSSLALSGPGGPLGTATNHGANAYFNFINETGGVNGRTIKMISYDDEYNPMKCIENTKKLIETDQVFALTSYVGTPTSGKAMPLWKNAKVPLVGFYTGVVPVLREPLTRYNVHVRPSYYQETAAMLEACVTHLKFKKIALFYQYDSFGEAIKKDAESILLKKRLTPVAYGTFDKMNPNVGSGVAAIKNAAPDAVVMVGAYGTHPILSEFVREMKKAGFTKTVFLTLNVIGSEEFATAIGSDGNRCILTQVVPPVEEVRLPVVSEYRKLMKKYYPKDTFDMVGLEGFMNAKVLVEGLKRAGKEPTREGLVDAIESMNSYDLGGVAVSYGPADHEGMEKVYLTGIKDGKYFDIQDWNSYAQ